MVLSPSGSYAADLSPAKWQCWEVGEILGSQLRKGCALKVF